jgi:hypothetical protein
MENAEETRAERRRELTETLRGEELSVGLQQVARAPQDLQQLVLHWCGGVGGLSVPLTFE